MAEKDIPTAATATYQTSPQTHSHWNASPNLYPHSHHGTPAQEYGGFNFGQPPQMPMDPNGPGIIYSQRSMPPQLQPLVMPQWPSMISSQTHPPFQPIYPHQPVQQPVQPVQHIASNSLPTPVSAVSSRSGSTPRRTLTDQDRKEMCLYAEKHPNSKQTEIGSIFGVERSTVSKVLRQKEKYLCQDDGRSSPVKRVKGRSPDVDKTLAKWAVKQERQGQPLTDDLIREKARYFAAATAHPDNQTALNAAWLEKFKLKHNLMGARSRNSSFAAEDGEGPVVGAMRPRADTSPMSSPPDIRSPSPAESQGVLRPAPMDLQDALRQANMKHESPRDFIGFRHPFQSDSSASISTAFTDAVSSSFSPGPLSPTSSFFTPDSGTAPSPFIAPPGLRPLQQSMINTGAIRPRSQTFPQIAENYILSTGDSMNVKYAEQHVILDSPMEEASDPMGQIDASMTTQAPSPGQRCHTITPHDMMRPPPIPTHASPHDFHRGMTPATSVGEAHQAIGVVMQFLQQQPGHGVDPYEMAAMDRVMQKLELHHRNSVGG